MDDYYTHAKGVHIRPGQWRPHYPWEHIAWISPTWPCQDYLWLDLPEAVFTDRGLLYLSHVNPRHPVVFADLPRVDWQEIEGGIHFERALPDGLRFGARLTRAPSGNAVELRVFIENASERPLRKIRLQTCAYLRALSQFNATTNENKYVHLPQRGWVTLDRALASDDQQEGQYSLGFRGGGPRRVDLPVIVTANRSGDRLIAMTWAGHTASLIGNPQHPCMHADPVMADIEPGQRGEIEGRLLFFEGTLDAFDQALPSLL